MVRDGGFRCYLVPCQPRTAHGTIEMRCVAHHGLTRSQHGASLPLPLQGVSAEEVAAIIDATATTGKPAAPAARPITTADGGEPVTGRGAGCTGSPGHAEGASTARPTPRPARSAPAGRPKRNQREAPLPYTPRHIEQPPVRPPRMARVRQLSRPPSWWLARAGWALVAAAAIVGGLWLMFSYAGVQGG